MSDVVRCVGCGLESVGGIGYSTSLLTGHRRCPRCAQTSVRRRENRSAAWFWIFVGATGLMAFIDLRNRITLYMIGYVLVVMVGLVITAVHEGAHCLVGAAMGFRIKVVSVGIGPILLRVRIAGFTLELRAFPINGFTAYRPHGRIATRTRAVLATAAGPLSHLVMAWAVATFLPGDPFWSEVKRALIGFLLITMFANLLPVGNYDGRRIWQLMVMPEQGIEGFMQLGVAMKAVEEIKQAERKGAPVDAESRRAFLAHLANPAVGGIERAISLNNLAVADVLLEDPDLLEEADRSSAEAMELAPYEPAIRNTRGSVLIRLGQDRAGVDLMLPTLNEIGDVKGPSHASLALGFARLGDTLEAVDHLAAAEKLGYRSPTLETARLIVGEAQTRVLRTNYADGRPIQEAARLFMRDAAGRARTIARAVSAAGEHNQEDPGVQVARMVLEGRI